MTLLAPLFLLGLAALAVPVYLHLRRRRVLRARSFSSLLFVAATATPDDARRRLDDRARLLVRLLALAALVLAFARPALAPPRSPSPDGASGGARLVVLVDVSASMGRAGVWDEARARAEAALAAAGPADRVALLAFDDAPRTVLSFEEAAAAPPGERAARARARLAALAPGFGGTDLGRALLAAAEALAEDHAGAGPAAPRLARGRVVAVSDLTAGARVAGVAAADWPAGVALQFERVGGPGRANVAATLLPPSPEAPAGRRRVRLRHVAGAAPLTVEVRRADGGLASGPIALDPGAARVVTVEGGDEAGTLRVVGDEEPFDDGLHVAPPPSFDARVVVLSATGPEDPAGAAFFLARAFPATARRRADVALLGLDQPFADRGAHLVIADGPLGPRALADLRAHLGAGRLALLAIAAPAVGRTLGALAGGGALDPQPVAGPEALLAAVDLTHPWLAPFADGPAGDFSRLRFARRHRLDLARWPGARVLARFDDDAPAWVDVPAAGGRLFVAAHGLAPGDGGLPLSTKFVPWLNALLEASAGAEDGAAQGTVGAPVPVPMAAGPRRVRRPDGRVDTLPPEARVYGGADRPGLYVFEADGVSRPFAVNLAVEESLTAPLPDEAIDRLLALAAAGTAGGGAAPGAGGAALAGAPARDDRQRLGRWVLAVAFALLLVETALAGGRRRREEAA